MTSVYYAADASRPTAKLPEGTKIVCGYIGNAREPGAPDTPHIWTAAEWNQYLEPSSPLYGGDGIRCLPIYTHDYPGIAETDAKNAADAAAALGWDADKDSRVMAWDAEFLSDHTYALRLHLALNSLGWLLMTYEQTPLQDPSTDLRWIFDIRAAHGKPPTSLPAGRDGWQYAFGSAWDYDLFSERVYRLCGRGPRLS